MRGKSREGQFLGKYLSGFNSLSVSLTVRNGYFCRFCVIGICYYHIVSQYMDGGFFLRCGSSFRVYGSAVYYCVKVLQYLFCMSLTACSFFCPELINN